jgi:uroporphyrinogen decarboxylase
MALHLGMESGVRAFGVYNLPGPALFRGLRRPPSVDELPDNRGRSGYPGLHRDQPTQTEEVRDSSSESAKSLLRVLAGEACWPPPVWLMRQAGRYLPEYRALRARAGDFLTLCTTPELAAEATLQPVWRFGFDAAILFSDIPLLPWALGRPLTYEEGRGPVFPPLRNAEEVAALDPERLAEAMAPVLETIRAVRRALPASAALIGFGGGAFTLACYLVDGGSGEFLATRRMAREDPVVFGALIDRLAETSIPWLAAQAEAGAEALMLFDSWAGLLPPPLFRRFVIEPTARIVAGVKARVRGVPMIGFPRLAGLMLGPYAAIPGLDAVGLDSAADPALAASVVPPRVALQGNLDPLALLAGGAALHEEAVGIATALRGRPHIFNLGHGVLPETPLSQVAELVGLIRGL